VLVSLAGWTLGLYRDNLDFAIPLTGTVASQEYFVVGASTKLPFVNISYDNLSGKFANSGQRAVLKDQSGAIIEELDATSSWFVGEKAPANQDNVLTFELAVRV
jgi:hypothetical protein